VAGATVVRLYATASALDGVEPPAGVEQARVAPDELVWLADPGGAEELVATGEAALAGADDALVVDDSDGHAVFSIVGEDGAEAFARVSSIRLPEDGTGFRQGRVAQVPGRVFVRPGRIDVLCTADVGWFVHRRLRAVT
jgi:hypothetical protein